MALYEELYGQTQPVRDAYLSQLLPILQGKTPLTSVPGVAPMFGGIRSQGQQLRQNALATMPRGGLLTKTLGFDIPSWEATSQGNLQSALMGDAWNRAQGLGFGAAGGYAGGNLQEKQFEQGRKMQEQASGNQIAGNVAQGIGLLASILNLF